VPTRSAMQDVIDACLDPGTDSANGIPPGTRLMTKPEFVAHITLRDTGAALALPGNQEFTPTIIEIPRQMIIHAIHGAFGLTSAGIAQQYDAIALSRMSDAELLKIYKELCHG
jgi:hypothetical protein